MKILKDVIRNFNWIFIIILISILVALVTATVMGIDLSLSPETYKYLSRPLKEIPIGEALWYAFLFGIFFGK